MPKRLMKDESSATPTFARFVAEPLEVGYGRTIGNSLRRVLLSSLEGAAISSVRIEGAPHEFCALPGVVEDVTDIILNLKKVLLKAQSRDSRMLHLKVKGAREVKAGDIQTDGTIEVLNPNQHIATLAADGVLDMTLEIRVGRGFCPAEWNKKENQDIGRIPIDSIFSPVRRVTFQIEPVRVEHTTDFDRLVLEIETDGSISPREALASAGETLQNLVGLVAALEEAPQGLELGDTGSMTQVNSDLDLRVEDLDLTERPRNCLKRAQINTVAELLRRTPNDLLNITNFGQKSLDEILVKLDERGLSLKAED